jgi:hypothetical protein
MTDFRRSEPMSEASEEVSFRDMACEEFWIVAKSFFAPVYGTLIVLRHLLTLTQRVDAKALSKQARHRYGSRRSSAPQADGAISGV